MSFQLDTKEFEKAMDDLATISDRADSEILELNAKQMMYNLASNTPKSSGYARAGWTEAWKGVGRSGKPLTRRTPGTFKREDKTYVIESNFIDHRSKKGMKEITAENTSQLIYTNPKTGAQTKIDYLADLNDGDMQDLSTGDSIGLDNKGFLQKSIDATTFNFKKLYQRNLKKMSGK